MTTLFAFHQPQWQSEVSEFAMHTNLFFYAQLSPPDNPLHTPRDEMILPITDFNPCDADDMRAPAFTAANFAGAPARLDAID